MHNILLYSYSMKAGINRVEFYNNEYYDENFLDRIVKAATDILGIVTNIHEFLHNTTYTV